MAGLYILTFDQTYIFTQDDFQNVSVAYFLIGILSVLSIKYGGSAMKDLRTDASNVYNRTKYLSFKKFSEKYMFKDK